MSILNWEGGLAGAVSVRVTCSDNRWRDWACEPACNQTKISQITNNWFIIFLRSYNDVKLSGFPQDVFFLNFQLEMNLKFWSWTLSLYPVVKRLILSIGPPLELVLWYNGVWEHYYLDEFNWNLMITLLEFWWRKWGDTL